MIKPWCVVLASREEPQWLSTAPPAGMAFKQIALNQCDPLTSTLRRAATVTAPERTAAVVAASSDRGRQRSSTRFNVHNVFVQPRHQGTAYEVLLALLHLERRAEATTTVLFLPADHIVGDEGVMTNSLASMVDWIAEDPGSVYLLGAVPQGPHDQLGYIVPWHDAMLLPSGVYEFVETPDVAQARKLINSGGLWNTFIFGGTIGSLLSLFPPRFNSAVAEFRAALQSDPMEPDLVQAFARLAPADFSKDLLMRRIENLKVLRLMQCGWWPLKSPTRNSHALDANLSRREALGSIREGLSKS